MKESELKQEHMKARLKLVRDLETRVWHYPQILELVLAFWLLTKEVSVSKWYPSITFVLPEFVHRGGGQS